MSDRADATLDDNSGLPTVDQLLDAFHRCLDHLFKLTAQREARCSAQELGRSFDAAGRDISDLAATLQRFAAPKPAPAANRNAPTAEEEAFLRALIDQHWPADGPITFQPSEERVQ